MPEEINRLGRTIATWRTQISNWHAARVTNAPTEAANNLVKRVKRAAFGFTNFDNYRIRALLYAGKPNWTILDTLTPPCSLSATCLLTCCWFIIDRKVLQTLPSLRLGQRMRLHVRHLLADHVRRG